MSDYNLLKLLGLSQLEIACYQSLFDEGSCNAAELAERLGKKPNGIFRQLRSLEDKGFVVAVKSYGVPIHFYANTVEQALPQLSKYQQLAMGGLVEIQYQKWPARRPKPQ
jgi:sugar-specific transcriptional regulator TrmB